MKTEMKTTRVITMSFNGMDLIEMLRSKGIQINDHAKIYVRVPGGGDWSNADLDIDENTPLIIKWTDVYDGLN